MFETKDPAEIKSRLARGESCTFVVKRENLGVAMQMRKNLPPAIAKLITLRVETV